MLSLSYPYCLGLLQGPGVGEDGAVLQWCNRTHSFPSPSSGRIETDFIFVYLLTLVTIVTMRCVRSLL